MRGIDAAAEKTDMERCLAMLERHHTPEHVIKHCRKVSEVALRIGKALNKAGQPLDLGLILRAGALHDIARGDDLEHAAEGARIVRPFDPAAADIIAGHMRHEYPEKAESVTEGDLVSLADRSVDEDEYVGFRARIEGIISRRGVDDAGAAILRKKLNETDAFVSGIERITGKPIDEIATGGSLPITGFLPKVEKPGRYIGGEINSAIKDPADVDTRFCFAFPDLYEIGMSSAGLQIIYSLLNDMDEVYCERAFAPAIDMEELLRAENVPLFTLETHSALTSMDIVGFTLQYEHSFTNIINMIGLAGIPLKSEERGEGFPIMAAGGPCACNPEPLADVFDIFCIGDGEELLPDLCRLHREWKAAGTGKVDFLRRAAGIEGIYIPSFHRPIYDGDNGFAGFEKLDGLAPDRVKKRVVRDLEDAWYPKAPLVPFIEAVHDRVAAELFRGCGRGCRFCQAGFIYRPLRRRSPGKVAEIIESQLANTGYDEVSLLSLSTGDYPGIEGLTLDLMDRFEGRDIALSLPSLRLDSVSGDSLRRIGGYKKSSLTFAPEAGTQRLRDVINKNITEEDILNGVEKAIGIGWNRVKFYFMVGLPTETMEDVEGIVELVKRVMAHARHMQPEGGRNFSLSVSSSNFVPKPHTPFQWASGDREETLMEKNMFLKERFLKVKGVNFSFHDTRSSSVEMALAKGDRRTLDAIMNAVSSGCRFDSWREHFSYEKWKEAFAAAGLPLGPGGYTDENKPLPWDIIDVGIGKKALISQYRKALDSGAPEEKR